MTGDDTRTARPDSERTGSEPTDNERTGSGRGRSECTACTRSASQQEPISVLAVTSHRPEEIVTSVTGMGDRAAVVTIDGDAGRLRRAIDTYRRTRAAIRAQDPDLLLLDCYEIMGTLVTLLAGRHDVPVVARLVGDTWRGLEATTLQSVESGEDLLRLCHHRTSLHLDRFIFGRADGFVTVSNQLTAVVRERTGCPPERIGVVPVPVTTDTAERGSAERARESLGIEEARVVLTVTNLSFEAKFEGVSTMVSELSALLAEDEELAYVVAGDGRYYDRLLSLLDERVTDPGVRERIYAPGYVETVADLYALADVFGYVSYRDGYPNAVLEAQTARLPVVANAAHGMCDQITDGETGYLVDPHDPGAFRERVADALAHPAERRRVGEHARERVLRENSAETISRRLDATLRDLAAAIRSQ